MFRAFLFPMEQASRLWRCTAQGIKNGKLDHARDRKVRDLRIDHCRGTKLDYEKSIPCRFYVWHRRLKCKSGERCKAAPYHKQAETARQWIEKVAAGWARMDPNQRRAVIAAIVDRIVVGIDRITLQWANAATMATRYANGALVNLRGEVVEPKRRGRPRKTEAHDMGEGLDLESSYTDDA